MVIQWIPSAEMTADILTKSLPPGDFERHRASLGIGPCKWLGPVKR